MNTWRSTFSSASRREALRRLGQGAVVGALASALAACGFRLRQPPRFNFQSISVGGPAGTGGLATELRRALNTVEGLTVVGPALPGAAVPASAPASAPAVVRAQVRFELLLDARDRIVVGMGTAGQVRELQLRARIRFRAVSESGAELIPDTDMMLQRDISFNETQALAKQVEEGVLFTEMQSDLVQQLLRRLAAVPPLP